jgi:hypothetical protein
VTAATYVDREVLALLTALAPLEGDSRLDRHLRVDKREFDVEGALAEGTWSSGERALIEFAGALWGGSGRVDLGYIASMSHRYLYACLGALAAYRGEDLPAFTSAGDQVR